MEINQGGGAEVRRIHVIYFLSRKGHIEHPHLIRLYHLSRNGVHLRDIKRWLAELRGKDMPESFAWSYKRKYKSGYVWQDLLDEDLITPISDNEYVLKGSEIASTYSKEDSYSEKKDKSIEEEGNEDSPKSPLNKEEEEEEENQVYQESGKMEESNITPCEIEQESHSFGSEKSILSDHSLKVEEDQKHSEEEFKQEIREEGENSSSSSSPSNSNSNSNSNKKKKKKKEEEEGTTSVEKNDTPRRSCSSTSHTTFSRSKSYSNGASHLFRNLMTCGTVDTRDSATVMINRRNKQSTNMSYGDHSFDQSSFDCSIQLCKGDKLGGSQRVFATSLNQQPQFARKSYDGVRSSSNSKSEFTSPKPNAAYKPINGPKCSQCGKQFKPEKLHAHMKSCKGLKAFTKSNSTVSAATTEKSSDRSAEFPVDNYSISAYYLTQRH